MKKIVLILLTTLFSMIGAMTLWAETPPLIHHLPSGTTLILSSVPEADFVTVQILVDKRSFKRDILKQIYVNAYLGNIEQKLSRLNGVVQIFPMEAIPESIYDPWSEQFLNFKTSAINFNKNVKNILEPFLNKVQIPHFPIKSGDQILRKARLANFIIPNDSINKIVNEIKFGAFKKFVNSVSLRQKVYLYIAGNFDLFRTINEALRISERFKVQPMEFNKPSVNPIDWYWSFVFWRFSIEELKRILARAVYSLPLRVIAPLTNGSERINVRVLRGSKPMELPDSVRQILSERFNDFFAHWYRQHYFYDLKWLFDDADQKGFFRLMSTARTGHPDILFKVAENPDWKLLRLRFDSFLKRLQFGRLKEQ